MIKLVVKSAINQSYKSFYNSIHAATLHAEQNNVCAFMKPLRVPKSSCHARVGKRLLIRPQSLKAEKGLMLQYIAQELSAPAELLSQRASERRNHIDRILLEAASKVN